MKKFKKIISFMLCFIVLTNSILGANASDLNSASDLLAESLNNTADIIILDTGISVNGKIYSISEFSNLLDNSKEISTSGNCIVGSKGNIGGAAGAISPSELALWTAGTWYIPGIGKIVITTVGVIIIGKVIVKFGTWLYNKIKHWQIKLAFEKSSKKALDNVNQNKIHHIMASKHNWNKFKKNPKWNDIYPILLTVMKKGKETHEKNSVYIRTYIYKGKTVVVRFIKDANGLVKAISTAWCK
ncbi:toxin 35 [Acetitomaculum ruminis DSM 5522]|uniref:Toxin 35 n=1 Tax=Acetitomaculum ruminis DSM 5522 TaxID=1120918 RepID=A0A1I0ZM13_9FIRM|nr:polymorphic toxin type 35 domain-containing protein [Acetitomaculum ruminis]SFB26734.1 toxin 35 [Acetitomaculum ruminis DSM 5522]